ncbi:hypothetical protein SCAR479_00792 [Seiridium cardinale]|uniref:Uncharacterized protein n=1 Tax=Seiridium cardinale TaxID=138064 RepID=A0ABR2Y6T6_9PEZI
MHTVPTPVLGLGFVVVIRTANASGTYDVDCARWSSDCNGIRRFPNGNASYYGNQCTTFCSDTGTVNSACPACRDY